MCGHARLLLAYSIHFSRLHVDQQEVAQPYKFICGRARLLAYSIHFSRLHVDQQEVAQPYRYR
jgi:hypothetical protein